MSGCVRRTRRRIGPIGGLSETRKVFLDSYHDAIRDLQITLDGPRRREDRHDERWRTVFPREGDFGGGGLPQLMAQGAPRPRCDHPSWRKREMEQLLKLGEKLLAEDEKREQAPATIRTGALMENARGRAGDGGMTEADREGLQ